MLPSFGDCRNKHARMCDFGFGLLAGTSFMLFVDYGQRAGSLCSHLHVQRRCKEGGVGWEMGGIWAEEAGRSVLCPLIACSPMALTLPRATFHAYRRQ